MLTRSNSERNTLTLLREKNQSTLLIYKSPGGERKRECVGVTDNVKDASAEDGVSQETRELVDRIYELEKARFDLDRIQLGHASYKPLMTISDNTRFHFEMLTSLGDLAEQRMKEDKGTKSYSIAPFCDDVQKSFVEYHKHSLRVYFLAVLRGEAAGDLKTPKVLRVLKRMMTTGAGDL
jgi:hypothetical protein